MFAGETVFIQVRDPRLIKGQWINSWVKQPVLGLILWMASVTSEMLRFRGEGDELWTHLVENKKTGSQVQASHCSCFQPEVQEWALVVSEEKSREFELVLHHYNYTHAKLKKKKDKK